MDQEAAINRSASGEATRFLVRAISYQIHRLSALATVVARQPSIPREFRIR